MSEQTKSRVRTFGAGLLGFGLVLAIGGGAMVLHSSRRSKAAATPASADETVDLAASMPRSAAPPKRLHDDSPPPLIGAEDEPEDEQAPAGGPVEAGPPVAAAPGSAAPLDSVPTQASSTARLVVTRHLDATGGGTTATAFIVPAPLEMKTPKPAPHKAAVVKSDRTVASGAMAASVRYGVTTRNELMGRAAGPVYNFKGADKGAPGPTGKMADAPNPKIEDIQRQLDSAGLPEEQRAMLKKDLEAAAATSGGSEKSAQ